MLLTILALATMINLESRTCKGKKNCLHDKSCQCYCARIGDFRNKEADDKPVYVKNDPRGHHCYCKQWDLDNVDNKKAKAQ